MTPTVFPDVTGNAVTTERWRRFLERRGHEVRVFATSRAGVASFLEEVGRFAPDIIHGHHALRSGRLLLDPSARGICGRIPVVISLSGTDIGPSAGAAGVVSGICRKARAIVVQGKGTRERLTELLPEIEARLTEVPKSFLWLGDAPCDLKRVCGWQASDFVFFMPAGIRAVKGNLECLLALEKLHRLRPAVRAVFAGPVMEDEYASRFEAAVGGMKTFARWLRAIAPEAMRAAYGSSDVVLNGSYSEGFSNALIEAMAAGKPMLASDIRGNRWFVLGENGAGPCGCLFDPADPGDFVEKALTLVDDASWRENLRRACLERTRSWPTPEGEAAALLAVYRKALKGSGEQQRQG